MFKGEKTSTFWVGLILLVMAIVLLARVLWDNWQSFSNPYVSPRSWTDQIQTVIGPIAVIFLGLYIMRSGVKKDHPETKSG